MNDAWPVNGVFFSNLDARSRENFVKYEVAIIELDMDQNDPKILDIFKRLNRTFYALSTIERNSSEFGSSEFMLVAKLLCGQLNFGEENISDDMVRIHSDPNLTQEFTEWAVARGDNSFKTLMLNQGVFTPYEISRMVPLQFTLNVMATCLAGFFNRNEGAKEFLENYAEDFPDKDDLFGSMDKVAHFIVRMKLPENSVWLRKANMFSLFVVLERHVGTLRGRKPVEVKKVLEEAAENLPDNYVLAAREAVNNKKERTLRDKYIEQLLF